VSPRPLPKPSPEPSPSAGLLPVRVLRGRPTAEELLALQHALQRAFQHALAAMKHVEPTAGQRVRLPDRRFSGPHAWAPAPGGRRTV
jgi:hypothetical protein